MMKSTAVAMCGSCLVWLFIVVAPANGDDPPGAPVAVRIENFTVPPATGPVAFVTVKNLLDKPYAGVVSLMGPEGWRIAPAQREVQLAAGEITRVPFAVDQARTTAAHLYSCEARATGAGTTITHRREVAVASAPYFKPTIDGNPEEWKDAVPFSFAKGDKKTTVSTYWSRRTFSILVAVEEDRLVRRTSANAGQPVDAVQFALAPGGAKTPASPNEVARRYEFLLCAEDEESAACYLLAEPGTSLQATQEPRVIDNFRYDDATVSVRRAEGVTYYECSLPMKPMRDEIRPSEGREFCFAVLVHDPDGTGIRDLATAAGLWPWERNRLAWSRWPGSRWPEQPPFDAKIPWGMCSSKY